MTETIASYAVTKALADKYGLRANKDLGQNFMIDAHVVQKIINTAGVGPDDHVIEIGPGLGGLTQALIAHAGYVSAIEIDRGIVNALADIFADAENLHVFHSDIMKTDIAEVIDACPLRTSDGKSAAVKVVANLPYYITTPIIMRLFEHDRIESITVMVQKEVAARFAAEPGSKDFGAVSLAVAYHARAYLAANVPVNCFFPRPKVDSVVVTLTINKHPAVDVPDKDMLFALIKAAFSQRRKTLLNCLNGFEGLTKPQLLEIIAEAGLNPDIRGEAMNLKDFGRLTELVFRHDKN